jgi:hypothetical protein
MHEFCVKEYIDAAIAADGDDAKLRAAEVIFHVKCQESIEEPFATAKSMGFPAEWTVTTTQNRRKLIWSPDGLLFSSPNKAYAFIGLKKGDPSLTDEMCNAIYHNLPQDWKAIKEGTARGDRWICFNPDGKRFSSLKEARDSLIPPADASRSTMAASADMRARDVLRLKEILSDIEDPTIRSSGLELLENIIASDDSKPAAKPSTSKPAAKFTKAKKATKPEANMVTKPIWSFMDQKPAARVSLDSPTITSAFAVTAKKGKGKKRTLSDSDDDY